MQADMPFDLRDRLIALGADKRAASIPLNQRANSAADWIAGTVVALDDQAVHADCWESHPAGDETLYLVDGRLTITLAREGTAETRVELQAGQAFIVPQGMWHRLHVLEPGRLLFITPAIGSEHSTAIRRQSIE